jgi:hypothetical protein
MNRTLVIALAATLAAVWYVSGLEDAQTTDSASPAREARRSPGAAAPLAAADSDGPISGAPVRVAGEAGRDLFATHSFRPPAPKVPVRTGPPPVPMAPPLPFRYQGRLVEEGGTTVFLSQGDRILSARAGDLLNSQYRVESVTASAVTFLFEPLKQRQTLTIGSAQ